MLRYVYDSTVAVVSVANPIMNAAYSAGTTVYNMVQPLPDPGYRGLWETGLYKTILGNDLKQLLAVFSSPENLKKLSDQHILCALHNPGLGLDLIVIHDQKGQYNNLVKNHYADWSGLSRDRLFRHICVLIGERGDEYENLIRAALEDKDSLLYEVLHDHRYALSYPSLTGTKPSTLDQVNNLLGELAHNRKLTGLRKI